MASDAATGKELRRLGYHRRPDGDGPYDVALAIAVSADGKSLAVCRMSHTIELWDLTSGKCTYPVGQPTEAQLDIAVLRTTAGAHVRPALAFSADGKRLVCSLGGETARQFQADTGTGNPGDGQRASVAGLDPGPVGRWQVAVHVRPRRPGARLGLGHRQGNRAVQGAGPRDPCGFLRRRPDWLRDRP